MANNNNHHKLCSSNILKYDFMTHRTIGSIDYVRVNKIDGLKFVTVEKNNIESTEYVRVNKIDEDINRFKRKSNDDEDEFFAMVYESVIVTDCCGHHILYHKISEYLNDYLSEYIKLNRPSPRIYGHQTFIISANLWVQWWDDDTLITKEIANGVIVWDPNQSSSSYEKRLQEDVLGKHGSVTLGYSVLRKAVSATFDIVVLKPELSALQIYGTVKAYRFLRGGSSTTHMLFDKPRPVNGPKHSYSMSQSLFAWSPYPVILVPALCNLTIEVDLWELQRVSDLWGLHRLPDDDHIVRESLQFTPIFGTQTKNITGKHGEQVQVSITCE